MEEYVLQLETTEAKLLLDPDNEELLSLRSDLMEILEITASQQSTATNQLSGGVNISASSDKVTSNSQTDLSDKCISKKDSNSQEQIQKKQDKLKKKKLKRKEKLKEQHDLAEKEKQSWQSFANKKGLKGAVKKSIFASPHTVTGKVGVGTNGIADAPSASTSEDVDSRYRRRAMVCEKDS